MKHSTLNFLLRCTPTTTLLTLSVLGILSGCATSEPGISISPARSSAVDLTPSRSLSPKEGALLTSTYSYGYPFRLKTGGELNELRLQAHISESVTEQALLMLHIHEDLEGRVGRPIARFSARLSKGTQQTEISIPAPEGVVLEGNRKYWLVADSATGAEILWHPTEGTTERFFRNVWTGEQGMEKARRASLEVYFVATEDTEQDIATTSADKISS